MSADSDVTILKDVLIPGGRVSDITLSGGVVSHIGSSEGNGRIIRCNGKIVVPAAIDMHVHMRDGPQAQKEDWASGTRSALAGGVTIVIDQPNTIPSLTTPERISDRIRLATSQAYCQFGINAGVTTDADLRGMWSAGAMAFGETFAGPSSYGEALPEDILSRAMETVRDLGGLMTLHAEIVHAGDDTSLLTHTGLRPPSGEKGAVSMTHRINTQGCRIHYCHVSSKEALDEIMRTNAGSIEVTPHHLFLSTSRFGDTDTRGKVNPPLRTEEDRRRLWECWDMIDVIASDHAPHTVNEKNMPFIEAPSGIPGLETMVPLLMAEVINHRFPVTDLIEKTATNPARILGICPSGFEVGSRADFSIYPTDLTKISADLLSSKAGWTPYEGMAGVFPEIVIMNGVSAYEHGEFPCRSPVWIKGRGYNPEA